MSTNSLVDCIEVGDGYWDFYIRKKHISRIFYIAKNNVEKAQFINKYIGFLLKLYNIS